MSDPRTAAVTALVERFAPGDERAAAARLATLEALRSLEQPFSESAQVTHITSSAVVVSDAGVLLHRHKRLDIWVGPGGHVDGAEMPDEAVLREISEETGVAARHPPSGSALIDIDDHAGPKGHRHLDLRWLILTEPVAFEPGPGESTDIRWVERAEALRIAPVDLRPAIELAFSRHPTG